MKKILWAFIIFSSFFCRVESQLKRNMTKEEQKKAAKWVDSVYHSLTIEDKIAQLFIVAAYVNKGEKHIQEVTDLVNREHIGGLILMQDDARKQTRWVNQLQQQSLVPMLIGIDGEWGLAQRFAETPRFPWAMTLGAITQDSLIFETAKFIALHCKRMGINWDFAPVVDINVNPNNPIIGNRSFGSDKHNVVKKALAYMQGLQSQKVLSSAKHFPGHGDTEVDSHLDLPTLNHTQARFETLELFPFKKLIKNKVDGIMVAHLNVPVYEKDPKVPASLSYNIITKLLKNKLGFKGLIITDALNMQGVAKNYPYGEMDYLAFKAGNDVLLFSQGVVLGKQKIKQGLESGDISEKRLEESVKKILFAKYKVGLYKKFTPVNEENLMNDLNNKDSDLLIEKLYKAAITNIKTTKGFFPLSKSKKYLFLPLEEGNHEIFYSELQNKFPDIQKVTLSQLNSGKLNPKDYQLIIGIFKDTESSVYYSYKISQESKDSLTQLSKKYEVTLCDFISPYSLNYLDLTSIKNIIITYQNNSYTQKNMIDILTGAIKAEGKLPVKIAN
ncbi:glycoside hydrolase family 3 protein [Apibacter adventoris]|uniref:beta-N-acetylhexosaminidase n=1 Tax=Apibacter adventoris TaxID=1679466 RepID=A0A2S8AAH7_9FLAO|nr:glycoside hydrolase family 3 protein [Apibacter adventoris]PQL91595.1 hypothetical protein C4S77_07220 [Apibacter adventoris]